ncbi:MAG TPA: type IV toxin-antitoxin system AbiEi family antitoxin [Ruania sp.]|nr:type IV toxin-antitoxin system AbiEi family antitoxin [Ruania sp.]
MDALRTIGRAPMQTVRPQDLTATYAHPRKSLADLEQRGVVHKVAHGYYCLVPPEENPATWMPVLEAAAAGVATAKWGEAATVLMGLSAARIHGALPRAVGVATVAVPAGHRPIRLTDREATIRFIYRDVAALDAVRVETELGPTLVTTPAQTALDLAREPEILQKPDLTATLKAVLAHASLEEVAAIAASQGRTQAALRRIRQVADQ